MTKCMKCNKEGKINNLWGVIGLMKFICPDCNKIPNSEGVGN